MNTVDKLERSVHAFIEVHESILTEKKKAADEADRARLELKNAQEIIEDLQKTVSELEKEHQRYSDIDDRKNQIKEQIQLIITKLNKYNNID
ncbi:hypothetical protein LLG96_14405 [bacterium]|nr:hypothetical protein [bacterium]